MAAVESDTPQENLEEKLGDLNIKDEAAEEKFEDSTDTPVEETPEEVHESLLDEIKSGLPPLHHVETVDTTDPVKEDTTEGDVVKAEVPLAFAEELKEDHDIVPPTPATSTVETVASEVGAESGETPPATREVPVEVVHEDADPKKPSLAEKISKTIHKIVG